MQNTSKKAVPNTVATIANVKHGAIFAPTGRVTMGQWQTWLVANAAGQLNRCTVQPTQYFKQLGIANWQGYVNNAALNALTGSLCTKHPLTGHNGGPSMRTIQILCFLFGVNVASTKANGPNKSVAGAKLTSTPIWGGYNNTTNVSFCLAQLQSMLASVSGQPLNPAKAGAKNSIGGGNILLGLLSGTGSSKPNVCNPALIQVAVKPPSIKSK